MIKVICGINGNCGNLVMLSVDMYIVIVKILVEYRFRIYVFFFLWWCSGCITSAETVMLEKQSLDEFLSNIDKGKAIIVSLSPQSRASLAFYFGISPLQVVTGLYFDRIWDNIVFLFCKILMTQDVFRVCRFLRNSQRFLSHWEWRLYLIQVAAGT